MADVKDLDFESVDLGQFDYIEKSKSRDGTLNFESVDLGQFDVVDQKKTRLNATMSQAVIQNPTQTAKVRDLSRRSGIPAQAVESDIPSVETHLKLKNINLDDMVRTHPVTSDYLSQYDNAAVAHDDIDTLKNLESLMNPPDTVQPEYLPFNTLRGLGGRITGLLGSLASGISQASDSIEENFPTGAFTIVGGIPMYIPPEQWSTLHKAGVGKDAVAAVGDALKSQDLGYIPRSTWDSTKEAFSNDGIFSGTAEALSFGVESGVVSLADMAATVYALPAYIFARSEEMGQARAKNKGMEKGTIRETLEAAPFAVGSAILERILPEKVLGGMSKTEIEKVGKAILEGATSKVKEVLNRATNGLIIEASTEAVQEGIIEYLGETYGTDSNIVMADMIDRALGGAVGGGIAGGAIAGGVETVNVNRSSVEAFFNEYAIRKLDAAQKEEMRLHLKGIQEQKSIDGINEYSANSELRKIDLDSFRQFIDQSDGDKDLSIFIDGVQAKLYVAQLPESNDPVVQMLNAKVSEAAALGSDVAIPIADFATMMAGTEHYDALREFMTLSGGATAPFRQEQRTTEFDNYVQSLMAEAEENTSSYVEAQDIYNSVREQLIDTGIVSGQNAAVMAQLVPAWATVFAQRNGITIKEAYEQSGLLIQGPQTGEAARLSAEAEQLTQMENQQAIAKGLDMSQEARMQRAKDMGFDTDRVVYHGTSKSGYVESTDIEAFDPSKVGDKWSFDDKGFFFTSRQSFANDYTSSDRNYREMGAGAGAVYPVYLKMKKPLVIDDKFLKKEGMSPIGQTEDTISFWDNYQELIKDWVAEGKYDSVILRDSSDKSEDGKLTETRVVFNPSQIRSVNAAFDPEFKASPELLAQNQGVTRGYYSPSESIIRLNEAANLSTFLHEFAHFMYEMELTSAKQTPDSVNMISSIHNWYKRNSVDVAKEAGDYAPNTTIIPRHVVEYLDNGTAGDKERDDAIRRAVHEQFARGFETYLMEGKAPSIELRNAFRTFARWLTQVYRAVRGSLKVNLDPEMRKVFDTLLATEEQINAAEARANYAPMFTDAAMAGMTEQEFAEYKQKQDKVKDKQTETLRDKLIAEITRQSTKQWKEELADEVDVQTEALKTERVYRAREALKEGEIRLDHAATKDLIGEDVKDKRGRESRRIPPKLNGMTIKGAQGVHPDEAAALLGYGSGDEMLADLMEAPTIKERAEAQAEAVMLERHGDILHDGTIEKQADDALLNEERGALILTELKALGKGVKAPTIDRQMLKSMAEESIGKLAYRNIHPEKYHKAEIRAAQESAAALQAGNKEGAMSAKVRQAMNFYLHKAATEARNDTMKIVERMARYNTKTVREAVQKAENGYWEQIVKILNRFEFRKSASLRGVDQRNQDINSWVKERVEIDGDALILTPEVLDELFTTHWKNVEYDKLKGINDSVKNIEHVARYANKIKTMGEEIEFKKLVNRWTTHMDAATTTRFKSQRTDVAEGRSWGRMAMAQMTKIPFLASWLDGGERGGMSHDILVQPFTDAQVEEVRLWTDVGQPVMELIENRSKADIKRHNAKVFIRELVDENNDGNLYGNQIVAVALNTGNAGNLRKMLLGEGWANAEDESSISLDNPKLQAILRRMTKSDWDLVQTIWDRMELLYPQLSEVHRRTTGLVPPKVDATPVQTPYGEYKGGYYPVKYDPNRSQRAQDNEDKLNAQVDSMFSNSSSIQASVTASSTNERTKYYAPVRLSLDVVPAHFQEAIHFITHHDAVRQANKLIRNPEVTKTIKEKLGPEEYAQLKPWLNDIAKDGREANTKLWWEDMIGRLRFGITLGSMGFKASTGIMQLLGVSNIAAEVGSKYTYQAFREILGSPASMKNAWDFASSNSKILNNRVNNMDREIKNAMSRINSQINIKSGSKVKDIFYRFDNSNVLKTVQEASMKHIAYIQTYMVDLPTWYAAYIKELEASGDESKAYRVADTTVEMIQGSGATKDLAAIMRTRNETTRMLTMFMTFFSSLWNMNRDLMKGAKSGQYSVTTVAAKLMFLTVVPVAAEMLLRGEFDDDDEDEDTRLQKFLTKTALYPVASLPFVRDIASGTVGEFGYNMSPVASLVEQGTNSIPELLRRPFTDEEITKGQIKGGSKFVAAALGIPATGQIWATGEHLYQVLEDGEELTARELLFGPKK